MMRHFPSFDALRPEDTGRNHAFDVLRAVASLGLLNLAFFSKYLEAGFYLPADAGLPAVLTGRFFTAAISTGLAAMDLFFVLSGYCVYRTILQAGRKPLAFLARRYGRMLPLFLIVSIPAFVYAGAPPGAMLRHVLLLDLYDFSSFVYDISSRANYFLYFSLVCFFLALLDRKRAMLDRPLFPLALGAGAGLGVACLDAPGLINFHFLGFFYGAWLATWGHDPERRLPGFLGTTACRVVAVLLVVLYAHLVWTTRHDEFLPLLTRVDARTFLLLTGQQALAVLLVAGWAGSQAAPARLLWPLCALGVASLPFFLGWSLYGLLLGRSVLAFAHPTTASMLFVYGSTLAVSLLLAWFFHCRFERGLRR